MVTRVQKHMKPAACSVPHSLKLIQGGSNQVEITSVEKGGQSMEQVLVKIQ